MLVRGRGLCCVSRIHWKLTVNTLRAIATCELYQTSHLPNTSSSQIWQSRSATRELLLATPCKEGTSYNE